MEALPKMAKGILLLFWVFLFQRKNSNEFLIIKGGKI